MQLGARLPCARIAVAARVGRVGGSTCVGCSRGGERWYLVTPPQAKTRKDFYSKAESQAAAAVAREMHLQRVEAAAAEEDGEDGESGEGGEGREGGEDGETSVAAAALAGQEQAMDTDE